MPVVMLRDRTQLVLAEKREETTMVAKVEKTRWKRWMAVKSKSSQKEVKTK